MLTILLTILDAIIGRKNTTRIIAIKRLMDVVKIVKIVKIGKKRGLRNSI